jgi:hemerythrin-like domain-containing protein
MSDAIADVPLSEHSRMLLAIHKAMRADGPRLATAIGRLPDEDRDAAAALGRAFAALMGMIHDHHWTEDDVLYPFLMERVDTFEADAVRLEDDHVDLDAAMARINARFRLLAHTISPKLWADARKHLADDASAFGDILVDHLDREESIVIPAIDTHLSEAEHHTLQKQLSKLTTYHHMKTAAPWVLANASPDEERELRAGAPRLMALMHDHLWDKPFRKLMAPLYGDS